MQGNAKYYCICIGHLLNFRPLQILYMAKNGFNSWPEKIFVNFIVISVQKYFVYIKIGLQLGQKSPWPKSPQSKSPQSKSPRFNFRIRVPV